MIPALTERARSALRHCDERSSPDVLDELEAKGCIRSGAGGVEFTSLGARLLLDMLTREEMALPCRCGHERESHDDVSPHHCFGDCTCRSFTPALPVYVSSPEGETHQ